jgi:hypothetical protein
MSELNNQEKILSDPQCPPDVKALGDIGHANIYLYWAYVAFAQEETAIGQEFIKEAVHYKPSILDGTPGELMNSLVINCIDDESVDHAARLKKILAQLPSEMAWLSQQTDWAIAWGYYLKGARAFMWDRPDDGKNYFEAAVRLGCRIDESIISRLTAKLLDYEAEFGEEAAQRVLHSWTPYVEELGGRVSVRRLNGSYAANRAFRHYSKGEFEDIPGTVIRAVASDPRYLKNRGVLAVLFRSTFSPKAKLS